MATQSTASHNPSACSSGKARFAEAAREALESLRPFLPELTDIDHNAARNGGKPSAFHLAALKAHLALAGMELSVARRNTQSGIDFYQVFDFATATARPAALNPVPELPTERREQESSARAGRKNLVRRPGRILPRLLPELGTKNLECVEPPKRRFHREGF
jgi:hypothetical protein